MAQTTRKLVMVSDGKIALTGDVARFVNTAAAAADRTVEEWLRDQVKVSMRDFPDEIGIDDEMDRLREVAAQRRKVAKG
ncbi:MAG: hypothetical protein KAY32_01690 [Candidatus Eisenbacteria sp.]|nr:hypothetical protein [Candidatus Eisenbacteria bacterium]